jgi:predicted AlkP superfamily pyrophosphatase or phosphodiesterase
MRIRTRSRYLWLALACLLPTLASPAQAVDGSPKLVVLLVVDQMRADYLTRFSGALRGGLAKMLEEGAVFAQARHDHAITTTAVGHSTIGTGCFPAHHGIVGNSWYDRDLKRAVLSCEDSTTILVGYPGTTGRSPRLMRREGVGDWVKRASPRSKVYAAALKDRSAVGLGGYHPDGVYWYNGKDGHFVSSSYYLQAYPAWLDSFNQARQPDAYYAVGWEKLGPETAYDLAGPDEFGAEKGLGGATFPHRFSAVAPRADTSAYYGAFGRTPMGDEYLLEFARTLVLRERVGADADPDLLLLSCSAADAVGHDFGPDSQEIADYYLRLDQYLGSFFAFLDQQVGRGQYTVVLTADHGVMPLPEALKQQGVKARRVPRARFLEELDKALKGAARDVGLEAPLMAVYNAGVFLNFAEADSLGLDRSELRRRVAARMARIKYLEEAYTWDDLAGPPVDRPFFALFQRSFYPERMPDLMLRFQENVLLSATATGTDHGSPYAYDTDVPLVFGGWGVAPGGHSEPVRTVDIAPSIADLVETLVPSEVDGRSLRPLFGAR